MAGWTREEEKRLLELYDTDYTYEEMAEALKGRSEAAIRNKLSKLGSKGEKREDLYIGGRGVCAQRRRRRLSKSGTY